MNKIKKNMKNEKKNMHKEKPKEFNMHKQSIRMQPLPY